MKSAYSILPASRDHIRCVAGRLRADDAAEMDAYGWTQQRALWRSWRGSVFAKAAVSGDDVIAVWGVGGCPLGRVGVPWLLTTPGVETIKRAFLAEARAGVYLMLAVYPELRGRVSADYRRACRFLEHLGITLGEPFAFGPNSALFREYSMRRAGQ